MRHIFTLFSIHVNKYFIFIWFQVYFEITIQQTTNRRKKIKVLFQLNLHSFDSGSSFIRGYFKSYTQNERTNKVQSDKFSIANKFYNIDMKLAQSQATRALEKKLVRIKTKRAKRNEQHCDAIGWHYSIFFFFLLF